jgi:hypothetical protein
LIKPRFYGENSIWKMYSKSMADGMRLKADGRLPLVVPIDSHIERLVFWQIPADQIREIPVPGGTSFEFYLDMSQ